MEKGKWELMDETIRKTREWSYEKSLLTTWVKHQRVYNGVYSLY